MRSSKQNDGMVKHWWSGTQKDSGRRGAQK